MPKVLIFAGANGSGKTTLANSILAPGMRFVNADDIQREEKLSDFEAGKKALRLVDFCISRGVNFAFETTMAGLGLQKKFERLRRAKYLVEIFYLFVYPVDLLIERIKERTKKGGHPVREEDVVRRYSRSMKNFWAKYRTYADSWTIINNNEIEARNLIVGSNKNYEVLNNSDFMIFKGVIENAKKKR